MEIIETSIFTRQIQALMSDDSYALLQEELISRPDMGNLIPGGGGIRKVRWHAPGRGKQGGTRVIYYWAVMDDSLFMLLAYSKSRKESLSPHQIRALKNIIEAEFGHG